MEMREPIGTLYNCNFLDDAKSPNFLDSLSKPKDSPKEYFPPLQENFKSPRHSRPIASDVKTRTSLSAEALQARDNNDPNKGSEYEIRETHGRLPLLLGEKF